VWAIEDCRQVSGRFEQALLAAGERVVRVPPQRMGASRKGEREPGKSDQIDALAVARAVVKDGVERSRSRIWTSGRGRSAFCSITALIWSPSELGRSIGCGVICSSCARRSSARSSAARSTTRARDRVDRRLRKLPADARVRSPATRSRVCAASTARSIGSRQSWETWSPRTAPSCWPSRGAARRPPRSRSATPPATSASARRQASGYRQGPLRSPAPPASAPSPGSPAAGTASSTSRAAHHCRHPGPRDPATTEYLSRKEAEGKTSKGTLRMRETTARAIGDGRKSTCLSRSRPSDWFTGTWVRPFADVGSALVPT
jgi:hypothetical protein